jgi:DNA-binding CsgD family transcriptional regulator
MRKLRFFATLIGPEKMQELRKHLRPIDLELLDRRVLAEVPASCAAIERETGISQRTYFGAEQRLLKKMRLFYRTGKVKPATFRDTKWVNKIREIYFSMSPYQREKAEASLRPLERAVLNETVLADKKTEAILIAERFGKKMVTVYTARRKLVRKLEMFLDTGDAQQHNMVKVPEDLQELRAMIAGLDKAKLRKLMLRLDPLEKKILRLRVFAYHPIPAFTLAKKIGRGSDSIIHWAERRLTRKAELLQELGKLPMNIRWKRGGSRAQRDLRTLLEDVEPEQMEQIRQKLSYSESRILEWRILAKYPKTLGEISRQFGICRQAVDFKERRLLRKFRSFALTGVFPASVVSSESQVCETLKLAIGNASTEKLLAVLSVASQLQLAILANKVYTKYPLSYTEIAKGFGVSAASVQKQKDRLLEWLNY